MFWGSSFIEKEYLQDSGWIPETWISETDIPGSRHYKKFGVNHRKILSSLSKRRPGNSRFGTQPCMVTGNLFSQLPFWSHLRGYARLSRSVDSPSEYILGVLMQKAASLTVFLISGAGTKEVLTKRKITHTYMYTYIYICIYMFVDLYVYLNYMHVWLHIPCI